MTETDLLVKFKNGDENAFKELYNRYFDLIYYYVYSLVHDTLDAEDITEEIFIHIWEKRSNIIIRKSFKNYLLSCAHNQSISLLKSKKERFLKGTIHLHEQSEIFTDHDVGEISDMVLITKELQKEISIAIENLPPQCRRIFKLSRYFHHKNREIADELNISINTVEKQISIAMAKLRMELRDFLPGVVLLILHTI